MAALQSYRRLLNELRRNSPSATLRRDSLPVKYIASQYRKYKTTDEQLCKAREEMQYLCNTYLCYLQSLRKQNELHHHYKGCGERNAETTANMVGFRMPHSGEKTTDV